MQFEKNVQVPNPGSLFLVAKIFSVPGVSVLSSSVVALVLLPAAHHPDHPSTDLLVVLGPYPASQSQHPPEQPPVLLPALASPRRPSSVFLLPPRSQPASPSPSPGPAPEVSPAVPSASLHHIVS